MSRSIAPPKKVDPRAFFMKFYSGAELSPLTRFRGIRLGPGHFKEEMICDCCSDDGCGSDDCCGFN